MSKKLVNQMMMPLLALLLLGGVAWETSARPSPEDVAPYHAKVRRAVGAIEYRLGDWVAVEEMPIPPAARAMLRPNALFSRRYENLQTGRQVALIIVQCETARDLRGHFPPICYPSHGWQMVEVLPMQWRIRGELLPGIEYHFAKSTSDQVPHMVVANFMILPDGRVVRDMKAVESAAADYLRHFYGAAQVQVVMHSHIPADERVRIVEELIGAIAPVVDVIRSGDAT
jgi:hypothetical protein